MLKGFSLHRGSRKCGCNYCRNVLWGGDDDAILFKVALSFVFNEFKSFEVRRDIEIPGKYGSEGAVLSFDDGRKGYFKVQSDKLDEEGYESILEVCQFLQDLFGGPVDAYILCRPEIEINPFEGAVPGNVTLTLSTLSSFDGDAVVDMLERKRRNHEKFIFQDYVCHILLPYMGCEDRDVFLAKCQRYMDKIRFGNVGRQKMGVFQH
jgi:hypothetical protein